MFQETSGVVWRGTSDTKDKRKQKQAEEEQVEAMEVIV